MWRKSEEICASIAYKSVEVYCLVRHVETCTCARLQKYIMEHAPEKCGGSLFVTCGDMHVCKLAEVQPGKRICKRDYSI
jgi:hypothetical protein